jgi:lysylphosphatidylglycerol synthetase-like protein (DUF2156 family)
VITGSGAAANWVAQQARHALAPQMLYPGLIREWHAGTLIAYRLVGRHRICAGPPCGPLTRLQAACLGFEAEAHRLGQRVIWFGVAPCEAEAMGRDLHRRLALGGQALLKVADWMDPDKLPASLRSQLKRIHRHSLVFDVPTWKDTAEDKVGLMPSLRLCRRAWLQQHGFFQLGFMTTSLNPDPIFWGEYPLRRMVVASLKQRVLGYVIAAATPVGKVVLIENLVRHPGAPNGLAEALIAEVAKWAHAIHCDTMNLGLTPLFNYPDKHDYQEIHGPLWYRGLVMVLRQLGSPFYHFKGLSAFKKRLKPYAWEPLFALLPRDGLRPFDLFAMARAFLITENQTDFSQ